MIPRSPTLHRFPERACFSRVKTWEKLCKFYTWTFLGVKRQKSLNTKHVDREVFSIGSKFVGCSANISSTVLGGSFSYKQCSISFLIEPVNWQLPINFLPLDVSFWKSTDGAVEYEVASLRGLGQVQYGWTSAPDYGTG